MSGNLARKRMTKFMPADFKLIETRQPPLKDLYDEWLARIICYAFSVPASAFVSQVNRATSETLRLQATQEGLVPLKAWIKSALDHVIQVNMNEPGLEFVWVGDDAIDPLQQAQTLQILVSAGIKTREEARAELGLGGAPPGMAPAGGTAGPERSDAPAGLGKFNPYHDEQGRFTTADDAVAIVGSPARKPRPTGVQVASNDTMRSDISSDTVSSEAQDGGEAGEQVAQAPLSLGTSKYSVDLRAEEQLWGGHAIRDHVGKSPSELISEVENGIDKFKVNGIHVTNTTVMSSYDSVESANDFINRLLQSNTDEVDQVANGNLNQLWIQNRFGYRTGVEAYPDEQGQITTRDTYNAGVLIVHDDRVPRGHRVKAAYPTNDANSYPPPVVSP
jgi:hypothetical protein